MQETRENLLTFRFSTLDGTKSLLEYEVLEYCQIKLSRISYSKRSIEPVKLVAFYFRWIVSDQRTIIPKPECFGHSDLQHLGWLTGVLVPIICPNTMTTNSFSDWLMVSAAILKNTELRRLAEDCRSWTWGSGLQLQLKAHNHKYKCETSMNMH